jgi:ketosteroid isomerase-like protein
LGGCRGDLRNGAEVEATALELRQEAFFDALRTRDPSAIQGFFTEDAVLHVANMPPVEGREAIGRFYENLFRFMLGTRAAPERLDLAPGGGMAVGAGSTRNEFQGPEGPVSYSGKYLLAWKRVDGEWFIAAYAISSDQPS